MKKRHNAFTEYERAFLDAKLRVLERKGMMLVPYTERIRASIQRWGSKARQEMLEERNEDEGGTWFRLTIDYRTLNAKTIKDLQPIGRVDEEINLCAKKKSLQPVM